MAQALTIYPAKLSVDYPDEGLNRLTTFFRVFMAIPIYVILALLVGMSWNTGASGGWHYTYSAAGITFLPLVLMLLFRRKYPRWWFDWNLNLTKFSTRVGAYLLLLTDRYPSTDEDQSILK